MIAVAHVESAPIQVVQSNATILTLDIVDDCTVGQVAATLCQELARCALETIRPYSVDFLPLVFIGRHDGEKEVATQFAECWEDAVSAGRASAVCLLQYSV
jgi:proteasome component ECM29